MDIVTLKQLFLDKFDIKPTPRQTKDIADYCLRYELRDDNPLALNSPMLGVHKAYFLPKDTNALFDIFNVYQSDFERTIKRCNSINTSFKVSGNSYNLLSVWLLYCYRKSNLPEKLKEQGMRAILLMLHYKFFCGKVHTCFHHGANEGVMQATIDKLSLKYDIKRPETPTWKAIIYSHVNQVLDKTSIHERTIETFSPDNKVAYVLSDLHTRISTKIVSVAQEYYANHAAGIKIESKDAKIENKEGERQLQAIRATLDNSITYICGMALNINRFISYNDVQLVAKLTTNIRADMLKEALIAFSNMATVQDKQHIGDHVEKIKGQLYYIGYRKIITEVIQKSYRHCVLTGVGVDSNIKILDATRNVFRASRISDVDILNIKCSIDRFIINNLKYNRESTRISLRTALILYFVLLSFKV